MAEALSFGPELRRRREAAGLSLGQLAPKIYYTKGYLSKVESGQRSPSAELARVCDAVLNAGGELTALVEDRTPPAADPIDELDDDLEVWSMSLNPDGGGRFVPLSRRNVLAAGAASLFSLGLAGGRTHGDHAGVLATLRTRFDQARSLGQVASPAMVLPILIADTHLVRALSATAAPPDQADLLQMGSRYAEFTGWMTQEAGDNRMALWWTNTAVRMAASAGDHDLSRYALVRRADIAMYNHDASRTIELAQQAQSDPAVPARIRGLAAQREAQGHALAGDEVACRRALDRAQVLLDEARRADSTKPLLGSTNTTDLVATATGGCLYDLGQVAEAAAILDAELRRIPRSACRVRARWGIRCALAHTGSGEVERACELTESLLPDINAVDSATIRIDLSNLARTLSRWRSHPPVRALLPELTSALRTPSA